MNEENMPGAALEAPETFRVLAALLWPRLPVAIGYPGVARWVALYVSSDHAMYHDGGMLERETPASSWHTNAIQLLPHISSGHIWAVLMQTPASGFWSIRCEPLLNLAAVEEARRFLAAQWPRYEGPPLEVTEEELTGLMEAWQEVASPPDWHERLAEAVRESRANYRLMMAWLDTRAAAQSQWV